MRLMYFDSFSNKAQTLDSYDSVPEMNIRPSRGFYFVSPASGSLLSNIVQCIYPTSFFFRKSFQGIMPWRQCIIIPRLKSKRGSSSRLHLAGKSESGFSDLWCGDNSRFGDKISLMMLSDV